MYLTLFLCSLIPVALSIGFYWLKKLTKFGSLKRIYQDIIIGVVFGGAAIFGTEFGVDVGGAAANARDAAPLCAGLLFSGPAGIIAGAIGGVERWFAVYWGVASYSRWACSISTLLSGIYAALLRKFMFDNKRPTWGFACATGIVMEVIHLTILFITHLSDVEDAIKIVQICGVPMIVCNAVSVTLACLFVNLCSKRNRKGEQKYRRISQQVQLWLLVCVVCAYVLTTVFVYSFQTNSAKINTKKLLDVNITDTINDIDVGGDVSDQVKNLTSSRAVGATGYILIADDSGEIISDQDNNKVGDGETLSSIGLNSITTESASKGVMFEATVNGEKCYVRYDKLDGDYVIVAVIPFEEVFKTRDASIYLNSFMEVIVFAILFFMIYNLIKKLVVDKIKTVNNGLSEIIGGNLNVKIDVYSSDEFASLSNDINSTVVTLKHYIDEASKRIDKELAFAKEIQHSALPNVFPAYPDIKEFDVYASMFTAKEVGGDFYDFYLLPDNKLAFLIADVSGKGIPAAMFMMQSKTLLKNFTESGLPLSDVFTVANRELSANNEKGMFVTAWLGIIDYKTGEVEYVNAGHNPPMVYRKDKGFEKLTGKAGFVLAGLDGYRYKSQTTKLESGDRIFLYTDGVTEATVNDTLYGEERLLTYLNSHTELGTEKMLTGVKNDVDKFTQGAEQFDDITMLMLDYNGVFKSETKVYSATDENLPKVIEFVVDETQGLSDKLRRLLSVAIEEIFVNVAHYAYGEGTGDVEIKKELCDGYLAVSFIDSGVKFNPLLKDDPDITESVEERKIGGLGIFMVKKSMDRVTYEYKDGKNILTVMKRI